MDPRLSTWQQLFARYGHLVDVNDVTVSERKGTENLPLVWPKEISMDQICDMFNMALKTGHMFYACTAPVIMGGVAIPLSQFNMTHERTAENDSYVFWVTAETYDENGALEVAQPFDTRMTIIEAMLYNLWMIEQYGQQHINQYRYHRQQHCRGSRRGTSSQVPYLDWDLGDVKVVLRYN